MLDFDLKSLLDEIDHFEELQGADNAILSQMKIIRQRDGWLIIQNFSNDIVFEF